MGRPDEQHYAEISRKTNQLNAIGATGIWLATCVEVWGNTTHVILVAIGLAVTVGANVSITHLLLPRVGRRIEIVRTLLNAVVGTAVAFATDWPATMWMWGPFAALAYDRSGGVYSMLGAGAMLVIQSVWAVIDGVPWSYPFATVIGTLYVWRIAETRVNTIRDMLVRSDEQRRELEDAHLRLTAEVAARERIEIELRAAQKLEALGRIAAGVAHEINTPIQFVGDSISFLQEGVPDVLAQCRANGGDGDDDLEYLVEQVPQALARAREGVDRVAAIVRSMKQFAHGESAAVLDTDLNAAITATLTIARHEYKLVADVETVLGELPRIACNAGEINQVLLNIVVNAAHAIGDVVGTSGQRGTIRVTSEQRGDEVVIAIGDTGTGIPDAIRERVFEPFFTTKGIGRGTGQGLAIARAIIERHRGKLAFESEVGRGTTFFIRLPIREPLALALAS